MLFGGIKLNNEIDATQLNKIIKNLYETNFFENVEIKISNNSLEIIVVENPIIQSIEIRGIKNKSLEKALLEKINLKKGSSFNEFKVTSE